MIDFLTRRPSWANGLPDFFYRTLFGVDLWQWAGMLVLAAAGVLVYWLCKALISLAFAARRKVTGQPNPPLAVKFCQLGGGSLVALWFFGAGLDGLDLPTRSAVRLDNFLSILTVLAFTALFFGLWEEVGARFAGRVAGNSQKAERLLVPVTRKLVGSLIAVIGVLVAVAELANVNLQALLASLGIGGIVIALAAKDSVENIFGSITILFDMPFALGDWVKIDKIEGTVEEINMRSTRIRTFEDTIITLPNANLIRAAVENVSARRTRRQKISIRLSYDNSPEATTRFVEAVREAVQAMPGVTPERVIVDLDSMDETSMGVFIQCHFESDSQASELELRERLLSQVLRIRDETGTLFAAAPRPKQ